MKHEPIKPAYMDTQGCELQPDSPQAIQGIVTAFCFAACFWIVVAGVLWGMFA